MIKTLSDFGITPLERVMKKNFCNLCGTEYYGHLCPNCRINPSNIRKNGDRYEKIITPDKRIIREKKQQTKINDSEICYLTGKTHSSRIHHLKECIYKYHKENSGWIMRKTNDSGNQFVRFVL